MKHYKIFFGAKKKAKTKKKDVYITSYKLKKLTPSQKVK